MANGAMTIEVTAPYRAHGGLVEVLDSLGYVEDIADPHLGAGVVYDMPFCGVANLAPGLCDDALGLDPDVEKEFEEPANDESLAFAIYKGIECSPFYRDFERKTKEALELGASHAVETAYQSLILNEATLYPVAGTYSVVDALAILEMALGDNVGSGGIISAGRFGATYLANTRGVKSDSDFHLWTAQGTPIINGAGIGRGFDSTAPSATDGFFMWATAPVTLLRGPVIYSPGMGPKTNTELGLAEQVYAITKPCYNLVIEVDPGK